MKQIYASPNNQQILSPLFPFPFLSCLLSSTYLTNAPRHHVCSPFALLPIPLPILSPFVTHTHSLSAFLTRDTTPASAVPPPLPPSPLPQIMNRQSSNIKHQSHALTPRPPPPPTSSRQTASHPHSERPSHDSKKSHQQKGKNVRQGSPSILT